jgi:hypothetical protein
MSSAQCPQCARPLAMGSEECCPSCGFASLWNEQTADQDGETNSDLQCEPDEKVDEATSPVSLPPKLETPDPQPPEPTVVVAPPPPRFACPACLEPNSETRLLCQRCGALLQPEQVPAPPSRPPGASWRWRGPLVLLAAVAAVAAVGAVAAAVLVAALRADGPQSPPAPTTVRAAAAPAPVQVDPRSILASASSELPPTHDLAYSIRDTLDGNTRTAWNNHSAVRGSGVGETLTYRFPSPVHLVRIDLVNGYAKTAELHAANGRIRGVVILTDRRTLRATLSDTASRQRLERDFGLTRRVTLRVTSIYPGARYTDLALTEIAFWAVPR